ncbi:hypothetical protein OC842_004784 [Tilletia horrida]|uniref:NAD(P)-binding protein n=1 Tax=Tilletia horrida TaxID=155126 RepID=A0AAN6G980_9BASI|nr:hypothetical protein OC842_004784 [Tilletia horrida]
MSSSHSLSMAGKRIFVAGGSRGIGADVAKALAAQGGHVLVGYATKRDSALQVVEAIKSASPSAPPADVVGGDLSSAKGAQAIAEEVLAKSDGGLDVLIIASGAFQGQPVQQLTQENWDQHIATNITGPLFLVQALLPKLRADGRIIFFSTSLCANPVGILPFYLPYVAAKGALEQSLRVLARDPSITGPERRCTVNAIAPGPVNTELFTAGKSQELIARIAAGAPQNRIPEVDEIVGPTLFLASAASAWVNGQVLRVNGGMTC